MTADPAGGAGALMMEAARPFDAGGGAGTAKPLLGACQWFHYEDHERLERTVLLLREAGVRRFRTGISWADFHRPNGRAWYRRQMEALAEFEVLAVLWHTPPSIAEAASPIDGVAGAGACNAPPRRLEDYADFVAEILDLHGDGIAHVELWNEPNNRYKWDFTAFDPDWGKYARMVAAAARRVRDLGKTTVLGGMIPVDPAWLAGLERRGALECIDVVAFHAFPEMWWDGAPNWEWYRDWKGWPEKVRKAARAAGGRPIWCTETGLATWDMATSRRGRHELQARCVEAAANAPCERVYWYSMVDLDPRREAIEGFHVDENEYHLGLVTHDGRKKPAWRAFVGALQDAPSEARRR